MYRVRMDSSVRNDITAATAVHRDLGPDYDDAVAESLVERIGAEIDKRVDARLARQGQATWAAPPAQAAPSAPAVRPAWAPAAMGLGSMSLGALLTVGLIQESRFGHSYGPELMVVLIWVIISIVNVSYARHR
jgi:hypothetical protein